MEPEAPRPARSRLFAGWRVPAPAAEQLAALAATLRTSLEASSGTARWESPEKLHATLHFLGDVEDARIPALETALVHATEGHAAFRLVFDGTGAFPPHGKPRVLFASVGEGAAALVSLAASVAASLVAAGAPRPDKPFHPHVTLARVKRPPRGRWRAGGGRVAIETRVESIALYRSVLGADGSTHTVIRSADLR